MSKIDNNISISIIGTNQLVSEGLKSILGHKSDLKILHIIESTNEFIKLLESTNIYPDIAIIDFINSNSNQISLLKYITNEFPSIKVIVLANEIIDDKSIHLIEIGISGLIEQSSKLGEIESTIRKVYKYGKYFNDTIVEIMFQRLQYSNRKKATFSSLDFEFTSNELLVLKQILRQKSGKEIASTLNLSKSTVENCRSSLLKKTNSKNTVGLVIYALKQNQITINKTVDQI